VDAAAHTATLMARTTTAVILVAGLGARLRPLTDDRPKALMDLGGETILGRALRLLSAHGIERVVLATGYREDAVRDAVVCLGLNCEFVRNPAYDSTQNSVSLAACAHALQGRAFFKLDGDVVFQPDVLERLDESSAELSVAVDRSRVADEEAMKVRLGGGPSSHVIGAFGKAISLTESGGESIGIERLSARAGSVLFEALAENVQRGRLDAYYEDVYSELIGQGKIVAHAVDVGDLPWTEVDTLEDLQRARALVMSPA
jgi:choline kinase